MAIRGVLKNRQLVEVEIVHHDGIIAWVLEHRRVFGLPSGLTSQHRDQRKDDKLPETFEIPELPVGLSRIHLPRPAVRSLRGTRKGRVTAWLTKAASLVNG